MILFITDPCLVPRALKMIMNGTSKKTVMDRLGSFSATFPATT